MERVGGSSTPFRFLPSDPENMRRASGASGGGAEDDGEVGPLHMARQSRTEETSDGTWGEGLAGLPSGLVLVSGASDDPGDPTRRGDPAHCPAVAVKDPPVSIITPTFNHARFIEHCVPGLVRKLAARQPADRGHHPCP